MSTIFAFYLWVLRFCWSRDLSFKGRTTSTNSYNDSIDLEVETVTWLLWDTHAFVSAGKQSYYTAWGN